MGENAQSVPNDTGPQGLNGANSASNHEDMKANEITTNSVTWDGPDDPENPKNWSMKTKWITMGIVSMYTFISSVSSTMVASALESIGAEFNIKEEFILQLTVFIFILDYAIGPLFIGPLSKTYGRVIVLQLANLIYLAFNIGCGVSQSTGQLIAFRFLSGLGGSVPTVL
ncbi:hypothetical protein N7478_006744 [Penicillium angulare]|uniref:uncharacterized protein n=1 Tax=Penicillium angulare TaxID=116970 RepID=UPI0025415ABC|nr:uncharacterized protein N7478_006744 [Penicillium angulare]KAJ5281372.1 hypothetical protein N7478_006744 [Penicillium angulare]